jgi:CBS domain-containing protein
VLEAGRLAGILTERDLLRAMADGLDPLATRVAQVMTPQPVGIEPGASVSVAASRIVELLVHHLPVVNQGELVGFPRWEPQTTTSVLVSATGLPPWLL